MIIYAGTACSGALLLVLLLVAIRRATKASAEPPPVELAHARVGDAQA
jgi:hypothetical protein